MDIDLISERYRAEMTGAFGHLADMVRCGKLTPSAFMRAQERVYNTYEKASEMDRIDELKSRIRFV